MTDVAMADVGPGNTETGHPTLYKDDMHGRKNSNRMVFTLFPDCENVYKDLVKEDLHKDINFVMFQLEKTKKGLLHLQGFLQTNKSRNLKWFKNTFLEKAHYATMLGSFEDNVEYCSKIDSQVKPPKTFGEWRGRKDQGKRTDLDAIKTDIDDGTKMYDVADNYFSTWARNYRALGLYKSMADKRKDLRLPPKVYHVYERDCDLSILSGAYIWDKNCSGYDDELKIVVVMPSQQLATELKLGKRAFGDTYGIWTEVWIVEKNDT